MSKERLEKIKKLRETILEENDFRTRCVLASVFVGLGYMDYLINRVQELEEEVDRLNGALHYQLSQENIRNEENRKLKYKNKRYREALEFYAEGKHVAYKLDETDDDLVVDYGEIARKALKGEN